MSSKNRTLAWGGEFRTPPGHLEAGAVVNGGVEVVLEGLWAASELQGGQVLHVHLDSLARNGHRVALGLLARAGAAPLHQGLPVGVPGRRQRR